MKAVRKYLTKLKKLKRVSPAERKKLLKEADDGLIHCICECAHNTLNSNVPLTSAQFTRLARHKRILRRLSQSGESVKKKRKIIQQSGGFLLPLLAPILGALLGNFLQ